MITINIAKDYTILPGGRFAKEGPNSGEDFRQKILEPKFLEAKEKGEELTVILDGGYGYATSFIEEAFGGLARKIKDKDLLKIKIISDEEPALVEKVHIYIRDALVAKGVAI